MKRPDCVKNVSEVPAEPYERKGVAGISYDLGAATGTQRIGVDVTEIPPGKSSAMLHHHKHKEEFFYVLSGKCQLVLGGETVDLGPGDAVARPAGTGVHHNFHNPHDTPCSVLMFGVMTGKGLEDEVDWPAMKRVLVMDEEGNVTTRKAA